MRHDIRSKDCSLAGTSDLTVVAPLRKGFVPGLDAVTYKTRALRVLRALHTGRAGLHEFELARMLSDAVERVGRIHSVRITVLEDQDAILLAVTFDGAWEAYVRVIWQKVARLLDLIFCNTEGYVNGWQASFEDWGRWLRWRQAETSFLYAVPGLTVDDTVYLRMQERLARADGQSDLAATRLVAPTAEAIADSLFLQGRDPTTQPPGRGLHDQVEAQPAVFRQGLRSLAGLYRLADLYPPTHTDGQLLLAAAQELLPEFARLVNGSHPLPTAVQRAEERFRDALHWYVQELPTPTARALSLPADDPVLPDGAQGGILEPYPDVDHGVVLLLAFETPAAVQALVQAAPVTLQVDRAALKPGDLTCNLAFTLEGLRAAGLDDAEIASFPSEFVQGMDKRAGLLGDLRTNHPRRWRLPLRNWTDGVGAAEAADDTPGERIPLQAVHALLHLRRIRDPQAGPTAGGRQVLLGALQAILGKAPGVRPLSLQWLERVHARDPAGGEHIVDHFDFRDGDSDPRFAARDAGGVYANHVHLGEALLGHANAGDVAAPRWPAASGWTRSLVGNASFLVVRKLRTDRAALGRVLDAAQADTHLGRDTLLAKMMGRWPHGSPQAGEPLAQLPPGGRNGNDFAYDGDADGQRCPVHAHIRRANPRDFTEPDAAVGSRPPRLFRRGMSYGPAFDPGQPGSEDAERGLFFMAYNASLGEQFEVVQRWLAGGNSAGGYSGHGDPLLRVPEPGRPGHLRFEHEGAPVRMRLDGDDDLLAEPRPMVRLEWGGYFLALSFDGLRLLAERARDTSTRGPREALAWSVERGHAAIDRLLQREASAGAAVAAREWKAALEDPEAAADFTTASIWAALRERNGGVLRTPYGVLVATRDGVEQVLRNPQRHFTSTAYLPRMAQSFGINYLGMDPGEDDGRYEAESEACNGAIRALAATPQDDRRVAAQARAVVTARLDHLVARAREQAIEDEGYRLEEGLAPRSRLPWELTVDVRELVDDLLASFCERWFGLDPHSPLLERGGFSWTWEPGMPPRYPGHFMAPSRYIFQPHPEPEVEARGADHGQSMRQAMAQLLATDGGLRSAPVSDAVRAAFPAPQQQGFVARVLVGAMMGMVPTVDANLRRVLDRWLNEGTLWALREQHLAAPGQATDTAVGEAFRATMQSRVAPDTLWRTVQRGCPFSAGGGEPVQLRPGDLLVAGLGSVAHGDMELGGPPDVSVAFGGTPTQPRPAHACPGYQPALAMMEGFAAALVGHPLSLQPGPAPLSFVISGFEAASPGFDKGLVRRAPAALAGEDSRRVWTYGDSWLAKRPIFFRSSLAEALKGEGMEVTDRFSSTGAKLAQLAAGVNTIARQLRLTPAGGIDALVVGGGGNDVANTMAYDRSELFAMLRGPAASPLEALDEAQVSRFVDRQCHQHLARVLTELHAASSHLAIPILVHSYANPIPDGRGPEIGKPWLRPVFGLKGMADTAVNTEVMRLLIGRLNTMVGNVIAQLGLDRLHHIDLRSRIDETWSATGSHEAHWTDELHPTREGFAILGQALAARIRALTPAAGLPDRYRQQ